MAFIDGIVETEKKIACHKDYNNLKKNIASEQAAFDAFIDPHFEYTWVGRIELYKGVEK